MKKSENKKNKPIRDRILILCFIIVSAVCQAQNSCYDIDFESGTLNGWTTQGNVAIVSAGTDIYGGYSLSAPGGNFSVKLGSATDATFSSISKSFVVTANNAFLSYRYAMDFFNYPHNSGAAARIVIDVFDPGNSPIDCAHYEAFYSTDNTDPSFLISSQPPEYNVNGQGPHEISYKPWTSLSMDLSAYIGQTVKLKATCEWCIFDADWAYAYFDFGCTDYEIRQDTVCSAYGGLLIAPQNFQTYSWVGPGIVTGQNNDSAYVNQLGSYTVSMTTVSGCTISKTVNVTHVPVVINASISGNSAVCLGGSVTLSASGGGAYQWLNSQLTSQTITVSPTTTTTYIVEAIDISGCSDTASTTISILPSPIADFTSNEVCLNKPISFTNLSNTTNGAITAWSWNFGDSSPLVSVQSPNHFYASTNTYPVTLVVTDNNGCKDTVIKNAVVHPLPKAQFSVENVCIGSLVPFTDSSSLTGSDILQAWSWNFGDGSTVSSSQDTVHLYSSPGSYTTNLRVISNFGCRDSVSKVVIVNPNPSVEFAALDTVGCDPLYVNLLNLSTISLGSNTSFEWNLGDGSPLGYSTNSNHYYTNSSVFAQETFDVSLKVTSDSGCVTTLVKNNYIVVDPNPVADFSVFPNSASIIDPIISFVNLSSGEEVWNWNFGDQSSSSGANPSPQSYADTLSYLITLIVSNQYGCFDTTNQTITIRPDWAFFVPNAFSPNGDGFNETFQGYGFGLFEYEMRIFDRWGHEVYVTDKYDQPWDGRANKGKEVAQQDIYIYAIKVKDVDGVKHSYKGTVTLVK